jgi:hypothetical protein
MERKKARLRPDVLCELETSAQIPDDCYTTAAGTLELNVSLNEQ